MLAVFFFLWLAVLSWEDLSVALPMQALSYVIVAFLAKYYLHEEISVARWLGIILVSIGVVFITGSSKTGENNKNSVKVEKTETET